MPRGKQVPARVRPSTAAAAVLVVAAALASTLASSPPITALPARVGGPRRSSVTVGSGVVPSSIIGRYLDHRPTLGTVTVVDVGNEPADRKLLAASLEGIVNRTQARLYLLGMRSYDDDQFWLDDYTSRGLITIGSKVDLDQALQSFRSEVAGYVMASDAEPWTINTATTAAGATGSVVVTPTTVAAAQAVGLTQVADHRGKWADAPTAYEAMAEQYRSKLHLVAIEKPDQLAPRDFFVQQGVVTIFTRPSNDDFERMYDVVDTFPTTRPVYGYVSDTGDEETLALVRLAKTGHFLVPSDTADNLSFHVAVGGSTRAVVHPPSVAGVAPCSRNELNVVIAMSDGDNLVIPESYDPDPDRYGSGRRGELPVGWGITPATAVLMPAIWDHYASTATDGDELVDMMGLGYALPSLFPDGVDFLADGNRLRASLGVDTHWTLDALISKPEDRGWADVNAADARSGLPPAGVLLNYDSWPGPAWYRTAPGVPVLTARKNDYSAGPAELAATLTTLLHTPPAQRPLVSFFAATVWSSSYDGLADAMRTLAAQGVRFLTPRQAFACLPPAKVPPGSTTTTSSTSSTSSDPTGPSPTVPGATGAGSIAGVPTFTG